MSPLLYDPHAYDWPRIADFTRCATRLEGGGLQCTRAAGHDTGHVYAASDAPKHRDTEARQEDQQ